MILMFLLLLWPLADLSAQTEKPSFRARTQLVEFTLVALGKGNAPIADLLKEEVEVYANGKRTEIAFFRAEGQPAPEPAPPARPLPPGNFSNRPEYAPGPSRNVVAVVLDTMNTEAAQAMWARAQVARYLRRFPPQTRMAVFLLGTRLTVLHDFTEDAESLRQRVEKAQLSVPLLEAGDIAAMARDAEQLLEMFPDDPQLEEILRNQIEIEGVYNAAVRTRRLKATLEALEALGNHLTGIPGRKNLIWIGGGISMLNITGAMGFGPHGSIESQENAVRGAARRLAQKGIALYAVDSNPLSQPKDMNASVSRPTPIRGRGRFESQQQTEEISADTLPASITMAEITGGRLIHDTNDPSEGMDYAVRDLRGAYSIGFYSTEEPDGKWHSLKVKVRRSGARLTYRQGYLLEAESPAAAPWTQAELQTALRHPLGSTSISIDASCRPAETGETGAITMDLRIYPASLYFKAGKDGSFAEVDIAVAEKKATGEMFVRQENGRFQDPLSLPAAPDSYRCLWSRTWKPAAGISALRVLVRDRSTGRFGTLDLSFEKIPPARTTKPTEGTE